ncbi:MAG: U2 snRNP complex subunit [Cyphobasidiales sp. Tagirdzhanova-0007]|nr:MAG: U2 snRNP complex subunit [Cyphobasidiales sp. Tagirdzhanova-0007]
MKLTVELITRTDSFLNPLKDRELDLRGGSGTAEKGGQQRAERGVARRSLCIKGLKIPAIENLGATKDSIDSLDLADNAILSLSNLPRLTRLVTLNLANNPITSISPNIAHQLPNLRSLVLTGTQLKDLASLTPLFSLHKLEFLSLASTPLAQLPHYRSWVAHNLPSLRWLDFSKVKGKEREHATSLFVKSDGAPSDLAVSMGASSAAAAGMMMKGEINGGQVPAKTFEAGGGKAGKVGMGRGLTDEQKARVRKAIEKAGTLEEIQRLKRMLTDGFIPDEKTIKALGAK